MVLASTITPSLDIDQCVLDYLVAEDSRAKDVQIKRRFEFHFQLAGVKVVMLHLVSIGAEGGPVLRGGRPVTHLVEVYECSWGKWMVHPVVCFSLAVAVVIPLAIALDKCLKWFLL